MKRFTVVSLENGKEIRVDVTKETANLTKEEVLSATHLFLAVNKTVGNDFVTFGEESVKVDSVVSVEIEERV